MRVARGLLAAVLVFVAVVLQQSLVSRLDVGGAYVQLVVIVVTALGLALGREAGLVAGFVAGLLCDLAPPADHAVGRWTLALGLVGYLAGMLGAGVRRSSESGLASALAARFLAVLACAVAGIAVFTFTGMLMGETTLGGALLLRLGVSALLTAVVAVPLTLPVEAAMRGLVALQHPSRRGPGGGAPRSDRSARGSGRRVGV